MSDRNEFENGGEDGLSLEEILADARQQMNAPPGGSVSESPEAFPVAPEDFVPEYGDAFDSYGEYHAPEVPPSLGEYEEELEEDQMPPPTPPKRKYRRRIVPLFVKVLVYLVIVGLLAVAAGYGIWECAQDVLALGRSEERVSFAVFYGDTVDDIANNLKEKGIIKYPWLFKLYCSFTDSGDDIEPGVYQLYYNYDYHALVEGMEPEAPERQTVRVMIPEGYTARQIFRLLESKGVCSVEELEAAAAEAEFDYWFLEGIPYGQSNRLEGFLFPDTYDFYESDNPERVLNKLLDNFENKFGDAAQSQLKDLNARLAAEGYDGEPFTVYELITVASMIEKETAGATESAHIASVIYNRLCNPKNYPCLQIDATVVYALGGKTDPLTYEDMEIDSPYNTYKVTGLPAGPISNPGLSNISAALNPTRTNYHYYALDPSTGMHHFSETYNQHLDFLEDLNNG